MTLLRIHPELRALIPPMSADERRQLTENLRADGCRDALLVWEEEQVILDGHNRYAICQTYELPFETKMISLPDLATAQAWMLRHQLGRRNLLPDQMSYLRGKERELVGQKGPGRPEKELRQNVVIKTDQQLADEHKVTTKTIQRDAAYAKAVDVIATVAPEAKQDILARDTKVARQDVKTLASIAKDSPQTAKHILEAVQAAPTPKAAKEVIRIAAKQHQTQASHVAPAPSQQERISHVIAPQPLQEKPGRPLVLLPEDVTPKTGIEEVYTADGKTLFISHKPDSRPVFNQTNEMVDWASWTWNPVTGCWHGCTYCYAREIANNTRMQDAYPRQFEPMFHPARLQAPQNTPFPKEITRQADRNVFTCSMADLFGKWVPDAWIMAVFERVQAHPEWNFLFLTKFPQRLQSVCDALGEFPPNAWVGCTVDAQARVATAERAFRNIRAKVRWLSVEPLLERLTFTALEVFDWMVIGGQTASYFNKTPAKQPAWEWVEHLWRQARKAHVHIYWKENLTIRPKETPWEVTHQDEETTP